MIWFACKQCGKRHGRGEHLAGTLVFCECGHGNRVPWSSTTEEPEAEEAQPAPPPPRAPRPPLEQQRPEPEFLRPRSRERRRPNPDYCLNHEEAPKETTCAACHASFCSACLVTLQGQALCGPCKNFRLAGKSRPARLSSLAIIAFVLAFVSIMVSLILTFIAVGISLAFESGTIGAILCCVMALFLGIGEMIISYIAVRQIDRQPALGGRSLALTGAAAGLAGMVWALTIAVFSIAKRVQG